jgi:BMFP domain-containing protein YqiC
MGMEQMMARLLAEMKAGIRTSRAKTDVNLKEMKAKMDSNQKEISASKEETKAAINSIHSELEETIKNRMENALASVDKRPTRIMGRQH